MPPRRPLMPNERELAMIRKAAQNAMKAGNSNEVLIEARWLAGIIDRLNEVERRLNNRLELLEKHGTVHHWTDEMRDAYEIGYDEGADSVLADIEMREDP